MEQYALYLVLKEIISKLGYDFKISFNDYDINGDNIIGILFKSGSNPKYRELSTGKYYDYTNRVQLVIQSSYSKSSLIDTLNLIKNIRDVLTSSVLNNIYLVNTLRCRDNKITDSITDNSGDEVYVGITKTHLIGDTDFKGKTSQTRSIYSLNIMFDYFIKIGGN